MASIYDKPEGKTLVVDPRDWQAYQEYEAKVGSIGQGAFAVSVYGGKTSGYDYVDCPNNNCMGGKAYSNDAMDRCKSRGDDCILFAINRTILVNYQLQASEI